MSLVPFNIVLFFFFCLFLLSIWLSLCALRTFGIVLYILGVKDLFLPCLINCCSRMDISASKGRAFFTLLLKLCVCRGAGEVAQR